MSPMPLFMYSHLRLPLTPRGRWTFATGVASLVCALVLNVGVRAQPASPANQPVAGPPPTSGRDPESQAERDWVDNRWSRTEVGQFLASNLEIPGARIAKGLSIRVGAGDEGTVCYDTAACALRAGWLGEFLKYDAGRFGLMRAPQV